MQIEEEIRSEVVMNEDTLTSNESIVETHEIELVFDPSLGQIKNSNISDELPLLCLSMIVKNEAHVILETLKSVVKYGIGTYVICDTGSTDDTKKVITNFFDELGIPGCIKDHIWVDDFGHSRTLALNECIGKSKYIWIIDADDVIVGDLVLPELVADSYSLQIGSGFTYSRPFIIRNDASLGWGFKLPLHEYLCSKVHTSDSVVIKGDYYLDSRRLGDRSKNPNKYLKDATILKAYVDKIKKELKEESRRKNDTTKQKTDKDPSSIADYHRCVFYMANSYFDHSNMHKSVENMELALEGYYERIKLGGWYEEVFYSWYRAVLAIRFLIEHSNSKKYSVEDMIKAGTNGQLGCKERVESMTELVKYFNNNGQYKNAYKYAKMAFGENFKRGYIDLPVYSKLFIHENMYLYELPHEFVYAAINQGKYIEAFHIINSTLKQHESKIPNQWLKIFNANKEICIQYFKKTKTNACLLYVGNCIKPMIKDILNSLKTQYQVYVAMDKINRSVIETDNGVVFITTDMIPEMRKKVKFSQVYLFDNVNLLLHKQKGNKLMDLHTTLIMVTSGITTYNEDGSSIHINNAAILSYLNSKINQIVVYKSSMIDEISSYYNLQKLLIGSIEESTIDLFEKKFLKYNFEVNKSDFDAYTAGISLNHLENIKFPDPYFESKYFVDLCSEYNNNTIIDQCKDLVHAVNYHRFKNIINNSISINDDLKKIETYMDSNKQGVASINKIPWILLKASLMIKDDKYMDALAVINSVTKSKLDQSFIFPNDTYLEELKGKCLSALKDSYLVYPSKTIDIITKNLKTSSNKSTTSINDSSDINIILTMTTCKRLDLFQKTINSFINACSVTDLCLIKEWLIIDDNSSEQDRERMKNLYPFINLIKKTPEQKGHYNSMKIIYDYVTREDKSFDYVIHMEDDFHFIDKKSYLSQAIKIFNNDKDGSYGQVLFNRNYAEVLHEEQRLHGGILKYSDKLDYIEHEHYKEGTEEHMSFNKRIGNKGNCMYWPHYSFRPSMIRVSTLKVVGPYTNSVHFEMQYAKEYASLGYKSVFFNGVNCIHIGKKTWEKATTTPNAYALNDQDQFGKGTSKIGLNIVTYNKFASSELKKIFNNAFDKYNLKSHYINTETYTPGPEGFNYKRFARNKFNYFEDVLKYNESLLRILQNIKDGDNDFVFILQDTVTNINTEMIELLITELNSRYDNSVIILNGTEDNVIRQIEPKDTKGMITNSFIISKGAAKLISEAIDKGIYYSDNVSNNFLGVSEVNYYCCNALKESIRNFNIDDLISKTSLAGYKFHSKLDAHGGDIGFFSFENLEELKKKCDEDPNARGFNTLGWIKHTICPEEFMNVLYQAKTCTDGLYVKIAK
jgi:glycosyltransferase involved in cell wall biosynthesis